MLCDVSRRGQFPRKQENGIQYVRKKGKAVDRNMIEIGGSNRPEYDRKKGEQENSTYMRERRGSRRIEYERKKGEQENRI
jgi:hypothetical protein